MGWEKWITEEIPLDGRENTLHPLWLDRDQKIASFHEMEDWEEMDLRGEKPFLDFIDGLVKSHYRFQ
jgi:hypothetical protein